MAWPDLFCRPIAGSIGEANAIFDHSIAAASAVRSAVSRHAMQCRLAYRRRVLMRRATDGIELVCRLHLNHQNNNRTWVRREIDHWFGLHRQRFDSKSC